MNRHILLTAGLAVLALNAAVYAQPARLHPSPRPKAALKSPKLKNLICYNLILHSVAETEGKERVWEFQLTPMNPPLVNVGIEPPDCVYKSLYSYSLRDWIGKLPPGTSIYFSIGLGPRVILSDGTHTGDIDPGLKSELDDFSEFCKDCKVEFNEGITNT